jgi:serine/threonine-protein kinase
MSEPRSSQFSVPKASETDGSTALRGPADRSHSIGSESSTQFAVSTSDGARVPPALLDNQVTIISTRGPIDDLPDSRLLAPLEVGKMLEGERLGQFVLHKFVGGGGMGAVFRALDTTLNREVAVKVLSRFQSDEEETLRRFRNEAQSAARLDHDNIARVYYVGFDRGLHYIVFEFIEGENLRDLVERKGPLPVVEAISYTLQVAEALAHASQRDVIHRDIKPSNVIISPDGKAKLVDMGLARLHQVDQPDQDITASGVTLGTFDYISPEQARDPRSADVRSDLYSLGCSLFFMLTGQPPFPHGTVLQKLLQHQGDAPPDARTFRPDLPTELCRLMSRLLAKNPADRFQLPGELIVELVSLGRQLGMTASTSVNVDWSLPVPKPVGVWERHLPWVLPLAVLVVVVLTLDYFWTTPGNTGLWPGQPEKVPAAAPAAGRQDAEGSQGSFDRRLARLERTAPAARNVVDSAASGRTEPPTLAPSTLAGATSPPVGQASPANSAGPPLNQAASQVPANGPGNASGGRTGAGETAANPSVARGSETAPAANGTANNPGSAPAATNLPGKSPELAAAGSGGAPMPLPAGAGEPAAENGAAHAPANRDDLLLVGEGDERGRWFPTVQAACTAAKSGDVVELRFNGPRDERPISLANAKLTIRAGEHFAPVVRFRPTEPDPVKSPRSMLTLSGGQLTVINVQIEMEVPRALPADNWMMFALQQVDSLRLERCVLTIRNAGFGQAAYHAGVVFLSIQAPPGSSSIMHELQPDEERAVAIQLQSCAARGEGTFLQTEDWQGVRLSWDNGWLATSERFLSVGGGSQMRQSGPVEIDLRHVTAVMRGGLALINDNDQAPAVLDPVDFKCADTILFAPHLSAEPLIEQRSMEPMADYRSRLNWNGDRMFYQGFEVFWKISDNSTNDPLQLPFAQWQSAWGETHESFARSGSVRWRALPGADVAFDAQIPADYALANDGGEGSPVMNASDGRDAGCQVEQLPAMRRTPSEAGALPQARVPETSSGGSDSP